MTLGQDLKARDQSEVIFEALRGILPVSRLIMLVGSGLLMGTRQTMLGCSKGLEIMAEKGKSRTDANHILKWRRKIGWELLDLRNLGDGSHWQDRGEIFGG